MMSGNCCFYKAFDKQNVHLEVFLDYVMKLEDLFFKNFSIYTELIVKQDILMLLNNILFKCCDEFPL